MITIEDDVLNEFGTGETIEEALEDYFKSLKSSIKIYTSFPDEKLSKEAIELKNKYISILKELL